MVVVGQPGQYFYQFLVDGEWTISSSDPLDEDAEGHVCNVVSVIGSAEPSDIILICLQISVVSHTVYVDPIIILTVDPLFR